jgi:hypothetical protein
MKSQKLLTKVAATIGAATLALTMGACASHKATAGQDYGQVRTEASATNSSQPADQVIGTAPAPQNAQGVTQKSGPSVIPGPAKVDSSGSVYTSSSTGGAGNGSATGLNTNVNVAPNKSASSVTVTQSPSTSINTSESTTSTTVTETPAPAPVVTESTTTTTETTTPMTSSTTTTQETPTTTTETTTTHKRLRKD